MPIEIKGLYNKPTSKYNFTAQTIEPFQSFEDWQKQYEKQLLLNKGIYTTPIANIESISAGKTNAVGKGAEDNVVGKGAEDNAYNIPGEKKDINPMDYVGLAANVGNTLFQLYNSKKASENYIPVSVNYIPNTKGYIPPVTGLSAEQRNLNERNLASMLVAAKEISSDPMANLAAKANAQKVVADARAQIGAQDAQIRQSQEAAQSQAILEDQRMNTQITAMNTDAVNSANAVNAANLQGLKESHYIDKSNIVADATGKVVDFVLARKQARFLDEQREQGDKESSYLDVINYERQRALSATNTFDKKDAEEKITKASNELNALRKQRKKYGNSIF